MTCQNRGNHNGYRGPLLAKINLAQVTAVNAPGFAVIDLPEELHRAAHLNGLRELTIETWSLPKAVMLKWATSTSATKVLSRLTGLTVALTYDGAEFLQALPPCVAANLRRLSLLNVHWSLIEVVQQVAVLTAKTTTTTTTTTSNGKVEGVNDRLEKLRVAWSFTGSSELQASSLLSSSSVRFPVLTTLHLVKSTLLHR